MIGRSSGFGKEISDDQNLRSCSKRHALEEVDVENICNEVCSLNHHHQASKRSCFLDLQNTVSIDHQNSTMYIPFENHHLHRDGIDIPVTRLEVFVVDGIWDDALEGFKTAATTELTSPTNEYNLHQLQQQHEIESNCQDLYWNQNSNLYLQDHEQLVQQTIMPKVQNNEDGRVRGSLGLSPSVPPVPSSYEDQENGNLSWLLDFKLDSLIEATEDKSTILLPRDIQGNSTKFNGNNTNRTATSYTYESTKTSYNFESSGVKYESTYTSSYSLNENRNPCVGSKKPPFTYTELIEHALQERGELTVSAIYQWITEHFPYYKSNDDRWKNSVRHNLSINPHFRKGSKAPHGAGHLWAIATQDESKPRPLFDITTIRQALKNEENIALKNDSRLVTMDEVAAATASIAETVDEDNIVDTITLEHCAEQILSGIKKEVEVQYLVPMMISNNGEIINNQQYHQNEQIDQHCPVKETDFLNPVSKEVVAEECGLINESFLVTDLNPSSLSLNVAESEIVTADNLFGEELSFQFYEFSSPSQLQSA